MNLEVYKDYERLSVKTGTIIFREKDPADVMYVIISGRVSISKQVMEGIDKTLSVLEEGEYFGEMSLLLKANRSATVTAMEDTELVKLERDGFKQILRDFPDAGMAMLIQLATRLETTNQEAILLALELALAERKPREYASVSGEQMIVATGSFEIKDMREVLRRRKELQWSSHTKIILNILKPGQGQDALIYVMQTDDIRETIKLTSCFKELVKWTISFAISTDDEFLDTLI